MSKVVAIGVPTFQRAFVKGVADKVGMKLGEDFMFGKESDGENGDVLFVCNGNGNGDRVVNAELPRMPKPEDVKDFQLSIFLAKVMLWGVGNRHAGYVESVKVRDKETGEEFVIGEREEMEDIVSLYEEVIGITKEV